MRKYHLPLVFPLAIGIALAALGIRVYYGNVGALFICWILALFAGAFVRRGFITTGVFCLVGVGAQIVHTIWWRFTVDELQPSWASAMFYVVAFLAFGVLLPVALSWIVGFITRRHDNAA